MEWIFPYLALGISGIGGLIDLKTQKIPNWLTVTAAVVGFVFRLATYGLFGILSSLAGLIMGVAFFLLWKPLCALRAGDIKLYMAIGVLGGWRLCLNAEVYSILIGGMAGLVLTLRRKDRKQVFLRLWQYMVTIFLTREWYPYQGEKNSYFSFGICIVGGTLAAVIRPLV